MDKNLEPYKQAVKDAVGAANAKRIEKDGLVTHEYPDYETYRNVQIAGNKAKLRMQYVKESYIEALAKYVNKTNQKPSFGLMLLDHTDGQSPEAANALDPFGAAIDALYKILESSLNKYGEILELIDRKNVRKYRAKVVVW